MTEQPGDEPASQLAGWHCPGCGQPPMQLSVPLHDQAFCDNNDCHVFMWTPSATVAENMADARMIDLPDIGPGAPQ